MKQKSDFYTKFILTVIAIFLGVLVFQNVNLVEKANASALPGASINEVVDAAMENISKDEILLIFDNNTINSSYNAGGIGRIDYYDKPKYVITKRNK